MASDDPWQEWFERIWAFREETLYRQWFGDMGKGIYCLSADLFRRLGATEIDRRWLHHGIFACPPLPPCPSPPAQEGKPSHWAYISSGLSNPWGQDPATIDPRQYSGLGLELVLLTPGQADWAITALSWLTAVLLLVASGKLKGTLPEIGDRIPLGNSVMEGSAIRHLVLVEPAEGLPAHFQLESGMVDLMLCVGITDSEVAFARENGSGALLEKLRAAGAYPITDPNRQPIL